MSRRTLELTDGLYDYLLANSLRETAVQRRLREETSGLEMARMQIAPEQGQFMALLAKLMGARRVVEVGTFTGYSALSIALALPPDGSIVACDTSEEWTAVARRYWREAGVEEKIDLRLGAAEETLDGLLAAGAGGSVDFMFIDADKESYDRYYEQGLELVRPGGLVVIDNVLWGGKVADPEASDEETEALRRLNDKIHRDERVWPSLVPVADGLTLALVR